MRATIVFLSLLVPSPAVACWDGTYAALGDVELMDGEEGWSADRAVELATWLGRIDALLPDGAVVMVEHGYVSVQLPDGTTLEPGWDGGSLAGLFEVVAATLGAPPERVRAARALTTPVFTVQAGAFNTRGAAERLAATLSDVGEHGFFETGGFPADNPTAHVIEDGGAYHVVVGAFVERAAAQALAATLGRGAFVRSL